MPSWERFKELANQRFGPTVRSNRLSELAQLPWQGTVQDYQEHFNALGCPPQLLPLLPPAVPCAAPPTLRAPAAPVSALPVPPPWQFWRVSPAKMVEHRQQGLC